MNLTLGRITKTAAVLMLFAALSGLSSCEKYTYNPPAGKSNPKFATDIQPVFTANCIACHNGTRSPDLREGKSYLALTKGGYVNKPGETSKLYSTMTSSSHAPRSTDADKSTVLNWINQGAQNN
ncbi:MAG TPA: hypothetical protein VK155_19510 [Bacteroidales bacterium]|nr:hypothetical protein [Bacteroidales bacterium]